MNKSMSVLFRAIPLIMGAICLFYGLEIWKTGARNPNAVISGHVVFFLTAICIALFTTAATIIRQLIGAYGPFWRVSLPVLGYACGVATLICGLVFALGSVRPDLYVAGHVIFGVGLITCCVATVALGSTKFVLIPQNSKAGPDFKPADTFSEACGRSILLIPVVCASAGIVWGIVTLQGPHAPSYVAGHVLTGLGLVCASLIALVASVVRQIRNTYTESERRFWPWMVFLIGLGTSLWGVGVLLGGDESYRVAPGYILIGLGIVCWSILSKVLLLAAVWRHSAPLASRIPLIPVCTALSCLFIAGFLFLSDDPAYFVPSRVMVGLGAICFTLFSIVSILESGTSGKKD